GGGGGGGVAGLRGALVLATTFEWTRAATSARVDMMLAAALTAVLVAWILALATSGRASLGLAVAGAALATLAKGPVGLVLPALSALPLRAGGGRTRPFRPAPVLGLAAALPGAWYGAALGRRARLRRRRGPGAVASLGRSRRCGGRARPRSRLSRPPRVGRVPAVDAASPARAGAALRARASPGRRARRRVDRERVRLLLDC